MDHALTPPAGFDRRTLARLLLAGTAGAALAEAGLPVTATSAWPDDLSPLAGVGRMTKILGETYDTVGPAKIYQAFAKLEAGLVQIMTDSSLSTESKVRQARATYGQLLTVGAAAKGALGDYKESAHLAKVGAAMADEAGDPETAGRAWALVATAQRDTGRRRGALSTARKAHAAAQNHPAGVGALVEEAIIAAKMGDRRAVRNSVAAAEQAHARLSSDQWGTPGYPMGTYHPSRLKAHGGWALAKVGMYYEAGPRLAEAAELLAGTEGSAKAGVMLTQASVALGVGDVDGARHLAGMAVAMEQARPSSWVASRVADLDRRCRGWAFDDLVEQTRRWGLPVRDV